MSESEYVARMTPTITADWLKWCGACPEQVALFRETFGDAAPVTAETLAHAVTAGLVLSWLAGRVLTAPAETDFHRVTAAADADLDRAWTAAWAEYERVRVPAPVDFARVCDEARAECSRVWDAARAERNRARDTACTEYARVVNEGMTALLADPANWREGWESDTGGNDAV